MQNQQREETESNSTKNPKFEPKLNTIPSQISKVQLEFSIPKFNITECVQPLTKSKTEKTKMKKKIMKIKSSNILLPTPYSSYFHGICCALL